MSNIKLIKAEIERMHQEAVLAACGNPTDWLRSRIGTCGDILAFIDSLPEDHFRDSTKMISKEQEEEIPPYNGDPDLTGTSDLEEELDNYFEGLWPGIETAEQCNTDLHFTPPAIMRLARHFAEWQKAKDDKEREENKRKENDLPRFYGD